MQGGEYISSLVNKHRLAHAQTYMHAYGKHMNYAGKTQTNAGAGEQKEHADKENQSMKCTDESVHIGGNAEILHTVL